MTPLRFTRRNLLRGGLAATAAIPLLNASRAVGGDGTAPTRFVVIHTPNGTRNALFWPTGSEKSFTLNTITKPLEPYKSKLTFLKGIKLNDALQNGALGGTVGSEHARGTGGMLTGRPLNSGKDFVSFGNTTSGWGSGQSLDQYLATKLAPPTKFKSLQIGVHVRDTEVRARISYTGSNQPVPPREDPKDVFTALFGNGTAMPTTPGGMTDPALARLWAQRKSVFDSTIAETQRLMGLVGADDRVKLDAHLTAMRDVETRLVGTPGTDPGNGTSSACTSPTLAAADLGVDDQYLQAGKNQMDLAAAALACDQTRILTFQWSYSESEHLFQFLKVNNAAISGNHHAISHDFSSSGTNYNAYNAIQTWYAEQVAYFLGKLDSYKEGERTLLDNTIVLWATEIGESTQHDLTMMPYVLAGSAGGAITAGRYLDFSGARKDNNQLLVSLAHAMGDSSLNSFGDPSGATGPLSVLTA
ncbi:MAG TPA: DUF1552 domain-containing protein [Polyangiaceae bacterium]|jgi:hypothetical protein|nr:DUF1552 domain-containing protein [Polyangiaceae bacterium]